MPIVQITDAAQPNTGSNPTISRLGTFANGADLYAVIPRVLSSGPFGTEIFKSSDGGAIWVSVANCGDTATQRTGRSNFQSGSYIYILAENNISTPGILLPTRYYSVHRFTMGPDSISLNYASLGPHRGQPPSTQGWTQGADSAIIGVRSDGSIVLVYCSLDSSGGFSSPVVYSALGSGITISYTIPEGEVGQYWTAYPTISGGTPPYTYTRSGSLPPGFAGPDTNSGLIAGYPTAAGTYNFTVRATDSLGSFVDVPISIVIHAFAPTFWSTFYAIWNGSWGTPVKIRDGPSYGRNYFPLVLQVMPDDRIHIYLGSDTTVTPAAAVAQDFHHVTLDAANTLHTFQTITTGCSIGLPYEFTSQPIYDGAKLWINVYSNAVVPGTSHTDSWLASASEENDPTWSVETLPFPGNPASDSWRGDFTYGGWTSALSVGGIQVGVVYLRQRDVAPHGDSDFLARYTQITPPSGVFIVATTADPSDTGTIWWATKSTGSWVWTVIESGSLASDYFASPSMPVQLPTGFTGSLATGITIEGTFVPIHLSCNNPPNGTVGVPYDHNLVVTRGTEPYTFTLVSGSLPPGLVLNASTGEITGTPTTAGTYPFTVRVVDSLGNMGQVTCSITIGQGAPGNLLIRCNLPPVGCIGDFYFHSLAISGGNPPYSVQLVSGQLPAGLTFDAATGIISGTPTGNGLAVFGLTVTDSQGNTATCVCSIATTCC